MSARTVSPARPEIVSHGLRRRRAGWIERATDADHKGVSLLYLGGALTFLVVAALELVLMRIQLLVPESTTIQPETFDRILSVFGPTVVVLFAIPLALSLVGYIVPLQLGARGVAFPRLGLLSAWLYLSGAAVLYGSFLYRPANAGILSLPPLSSSTFSPTHGVDAWAIGVGLCAVGFTCFAVNMLATARTMRAPGMAWRRAPIFSWAGAAICWIQLVTAPLMVAALAMLMIDRNFSGIFFDSQHGGAPVLYEHFAWIFYTGAYTCVLLLAAGAISEILPTFARTPIFSHRWATGSIAAIAVLGPLAWMQNMYTAPIATGFAFFAMLMAVGLLVPVGLLVVNWVGTLWGGVLRMRAAPLYAAGAISCLLLGLGGELMYSLVPVGWELNNTTAAQGDTAFVIVGGGVFGGLAALHYWFPKLTGRMLGEAVGRIAFWTIFIGLQAFVWPMLLAGLKGQPVDIQRFYDGLGLNTYNLVASIGSFVLFLGIVIAAVNVAVSFRAGRRTGHDPWAGTTLEWFALSPPPLHNFDAVPDVRSAEPLRDIREAIRERDELWPARRPRPPVAEPVVAGAGATEPKSSEQAEGASVLPSESVPGAPESGSEAADAIPPPGRSTDPGEGGSDAERASRAEDAGGPDEGDTPVSSS
jgi:heme/copper-type cytochrome/quinol oxidase subunit 1